MSYETMEAFLKHFVQGVAITRDEDKKLNVAGWRSNMPGNAAPDDLLARYRQVGIAFEAADEAILLRKTKTA